MPVLQEKIAECEVCHPVVGALIEPTPPLAVNSLKSLSQVVIQSCLLSIKICPVTMKVH